MKENVLEILSEPEDEVQDMREQGENDLRTVLIYIRNATYKIKELEGK